MEYPQTAMPPKAEAADDTRALAPGTRLGELEIVRVLGDGGFGVVYLATDHALALVVAIKEYLPATLALHGALGQVRLRSAFDDDAFERGRLAFIDEARILARCEHPSLLRVHRVWDANGTVYRLMPHYAGQNLIAVRRGMSKPPNEASLRALLDALLAALETLHDAGHLHGEVTPANILLLPDDRPLVLDFGAVRRAVLGDATRPAVAAVGLSSPRPGAESANAARGPWSDLHALAAVAQFCISGELPSQAPAAHEGLRHALLPGAPAGLSADAAQRGYSASFCAVLDALQCAPPNEAPGAAASCRALLRQVAAPRAAAWIDPVPNPRPAAGGVGAVGAAEPELSEDEFFADLNQSMAAAAREVKLRESAAAMRSARAAAAAQTLARPHSARVASWGGAALVALAFGAAGWKLNDHLGVDAAAGKFGAVATPDAVLAAAPAGAPADRRAAAADNAPSPPPLRQAAARPPDSTVERTGSSADKAASRVRAAARAGGSPREECGNRTEFALYRCMQTECAQPRWATHAQCARLRATDEID